jgi:hypothetical protein
MLSHVLVVGRVVPEPKIQYVGNFEDVVKKLLGVAFVLSIEKHQHAVEHRLAKVVPIKVTHQVESLDSGQELGARLLVLFLLTVLMRLTAALAGDC